VVHVGGEERVVKVQLTHRCGVRPRRPLARDAGGRVDTDDSRTTDVRVSQRLGARGGDGMAPESGDRDAGVVDHAIDDHLGHVVVECYRVRGDDGELPRQEFLAWGCRHAGINPYVVFSHCSSRSLGRRRGPIVGHRLVQPRGRPEENCTEAVARILLAYARAVTSGDE
jgi:hypothetical protein